ncbi:hypothetical protein SBBP2_680004 [Burkholderiales bacterium]|nr:hypothetical protein SBBP2_680004 [Burkholderiales bacterium]
MLVGDGWPGEQVLTERGAVVHGWRVPCHVLRELA